MSNDIVPAHNAQITDVRNDFAKYGRSSSLYSRSLEWADANSGRSLFGPHPNHNFGPKGKLGGCPDLPQHGGMIDPTTQRLEWNSSPQNVLIIKKHLDPTVTSHFMRLAKWLIIERNMTVLVENSVINENELILDTEFSQRCLPKLQVYQEDLQDKGTKDVQGVVDLIICLGGDGTLIHVSSLFQSTCPPVIAFHLGSLGFLTQFSIKTFAKDMCGVLSGDVGISLRSRLKCQVRAFNEKEEEEIQFEYIVLNEVTFDRGQSSQVTNIDIYCNGRYLTSLIGDGLIISTPTGSTAYSMAAGASLVHPSVPGIMLTPICPHSLSFRPIVLPAGVELKIMVASESRNRQPVCAFDGRQQKVMHDSRYLRVTTSVYPIPCISRQGHLTDWFDSLAECLHWNRRENKRVPAAIVKPARLLQNRKPR